ncbi:metal-dependent hydrolase [Antrihabitans sp. YC3-6]|uniref:Metal-dependent hydrolase n=1 Tax=Antrihabitans stalagmiti TaxID=2799499 RepID=A0A934U6G5_9NOCA|nr:metal-dependent hydrolase [Antrihabitans stalagmiti]MBJ8342555.1 metal-dependent hydrolase [Antrihabitans stalagmiti]
MSTETLHVVEPENLVLQPRQVAFDWANVPMHYIPGDPVATHTINVLHLLLPEGEDWFVATFKEALPFIDDEKLRDDVIGFIGQESMHSGAHTGVLDHLASNGIDPTPFTDQLHWLFDKLLGPRPITGLKEQNYLVERLALIAAIEHITAFLGDWVLNAEGLDRADMHPTMIDLLRWHGAEEVEHRAVAYDVLMYFDKRYIRRARTQALVIPVIVYLWVRGVRFLMANDPALAPQSKHRRKPHWSDYFHAARRGVLPNPATLLLRMSTYFLPGYHPSKEGSTAQAVAYLASSPAARAAS